MDWRRWGSSRFCQKFLSDSIRFFRGKNYSVPDDTWDRNFFCIQGVSQFSIKIFALQYQKKLEGTFSWFQKASGIKTLRPLEKGGYPDFPAKKLFSQSTETSLRKTLLCFEKFLVLNFLRIREREREREREGETKREKQKEMERERERK